MSCCNEKENEIKFIKGDVLEIYFVVGDIEVEYIERVVFSCIGAKILCDLPYSEEQGAYCLRFNSQISDVIPAGFYTYDVTMELKGGSKITLLHNEDFIVLKKHNTLHEEEYIDEPNDEGEANDDEEPDEPVTPPEEGGDNECEGDDENGNSDDNGEGSGTPSGSDKPEPEQPIDGDDETPVTPPDDGEEGDDDSK